MCTRNYFFTRENTKLTNCFGFTPIISMVYMAQRFLDRQGSRLGDIRNHEIIRAML
jgi:hypothetical protein